jgi:hypothetical protein
MATTQTDQATLDKGLITTDQTAPQKAVLSQGVNILVLGPTGTGKTHSLGTIADAGMDLFVLFTESGLETLLGYWTDRGKEVPPNVHWHVLPQAEVTFAVLAKAAELVHTIDHASLLRMRDPDFAKHNQFITLLRALSDFPDDRTGKKFGAVDAWEPNRWLAIDSLTGVNPIAMSLVIGGKPVKGPGDYGKAQDQIEKMIREFCFTCRCHFTLIAHPEREIDQIGGGVKLYPSMPGKALAPILPPMFSDVILSYRESGPKFYWSTDDSQADLKARNLPWAKGIQQDFKIILDKWKSRGGRV